MTIIELAQSAIAAADPTEWLTLLSLCVLAKLDDRRPVRHFRWWSRSPWLSGASPFNFSTGVHSRAWRVSRETRRASDTVRHYGSYLADPLAERTPIGQRGPR